MSKLENTLRCRHRHNITEHPKCFSDGKPKTFSREDFLSAKIGIMDIETLPAVSYHWGMYDQNIYAEQLIQESCLLSWAGKYLNESKMYSDILTKEEAISRNPQRISLSAFEFINSCKFIIGHNWRAFDGKTLNNYFLIYAKPVKYQVIDTLEIARNNFKFMSNKLSFINNKLGIVNKVEHEGFGLWKSCSEGSQEALNKMMEYNVGDIIATETLYYKLRPFMPKHPNFSLYNELEAEQCPVCLSLELSTEGRYGVYEEVRCQKCGAISRRKYSVLTKEKKKASLVKI